MGRGLEGGQPASWEKASARVWRDSSEGQTRQMDDGLLLLVKRTGGEVKGCTSWEGAEAEDVE